MAPQQMEAAATGYTDHGHTWSTPEDCGGCKAVSGKTDCTKCDHTGKVKCNRSGCQCGGDGSYVQCTRCGGVWSSASEFPSPHNCPSNGGNPTGYSTKSCMISCSTCGGDGALSTTCVRCNGKGQNYECTKDGCNLTSGSALKSDGTGRTFDHWESETTAPKTGSLTVCYTTENTYNIAFNGNGSTSGSTAGKTGIKYTTSTTLTSNGFSRTGYTFAGWNNNASGTGTSYANGASVSKLTATNGATVTLYAKWTENTYTIAFNGNGNTGGSTANKTGVRYTASTTLTSNGYSRTGYTFTGWNTAANGSGTSYGNGASVSKLTATNGGTVTLYAQWTPNTYKMIHKANGGTGSDVTTSHSFNGTYTVKGSNTFTRKGYSFNGWNTAANGSGASYSAGQTGTCTWAYDVTLYAQWKANTYKVTVNPSGGKYNNTTNATVHSVTTGNSVNITNPTRTGYTFKGWTISSNDATITDITNGKNVKVLSTDVTLTANWQQNNYTVTYHSNGGSTQNSTKTYHYGDAVDLNVAPQRAGYIFVGWATTSNATVPLTTLTMPDLATSTDASHKDGELTLYAIYSMSVSDISGHNYPDHPQGANANVYLVIWKNGEQQNARTYPLTYQYDVSVMRYRYKLSTTSMADFVTIGNTYTYEVVAIDNAGNKGTITRGIFTKSGPSSQPPTEQYVPPKKYLQTVYHYKKDAVTGDWIKFDTTTEMVLENTSFTPSHISAPDGYSKGDITYPEGYTITNNSYTVTGEAVSHAYYEPNEYKLTFNAMGGTCDTDYKMITYSAYYGDMPTPVKRGYTFLGWYSAENGGTQVLSSHRYATAGNSTVYAHWKVNAYRVTYDYWTNGGTAVSTGGADVNYGAGVPLTATATKEGWTFVGWSTDPDAIEKTTSLTMSDTDITVYAIYKKDITVTIVEQTDSGKETRTPTKTIYNKETEIDFTLTEVNGLSGWTLLGWTEEVTTEGDPQVEKGGILILSESITLYGLYEKAITVSYDTNGSGLTYDPLTQYARHNANGTSKYHSFTLKNAPELSGSSFVKWKERSGTLYAPGDVITPTESMHFTAVWDKHPDLWASNRHFTLEQARGGEITQAELLSKVTFVDEEDGAFENGRNVTIKDYDASVFTELETDTVISIIYEAEDSFGNKVSRTVTVTVTDTTAKKVNKKTYVRFISSDYLADDTGTLLSKADGGLEETSVWRTNSSYRNLLIRTLSRTKTDVETWVYTRSDIQKLKQQKNAGKN